MGRPRLRRSIAGPNPETDLPIFIVAAGLTAFGQFRAANSSLRRADGEETRSSARLS